MTGWRVGWLIAPTDFAAAATNLQSHTTSNVSNVSQAAALAALTGDLEFTATMRAAFDARRRRMHEMLSGIPGVACLEPEGAFYAFPSFEGVLGRDIGGEQPETSLDPAEGLSGPTGRAAGRRAGDGPDLDLSRITAPPAAVTTLERAGYDVAASRPDGTTEVVLGPGEFARLTAAGFHPTRWRDPGGRSVEDVAAGECGGPATVWRHWDGAGGLHAEIDALAAAHPDLVRTEVVGRSVERRDIVAVRVTAGA